MSSRSVLRDIAHLLGGSIGIQLIGLVKGLLIPVIVTPREYGAWRTLLMIWQFGIHLHLGTFEVLARELPGLYVRNDEHAVRRLRQNALWGSMAAAALAAVVLLALAAVGAVGGDSRERWAVLAAAVAIVVQQYMSYQLVLWRSSTEFGRMSAAAFGNAALSLVLCLALAPFFGVPGLAFGTLASLVIVVAIMSRWTARDPFRLEPASWRQLVGEGLPLAALPFLSVAMMNVGQAICSALLNSEQTGYYSIGTMFGTVVFAIPNALGMALYPRYLEQYARTGGGSDFGDLVRRSLRLTSVVAFSVVCATIVILEPIFRWRFAKYMPGLTAAYVQLVAMIFVSHALTVQNALLALRRQRSVLLMQSGGLLLSIVCGAVLCAVFRTVTAVAIGVAVGQVVSSVVVVAATLRWTQRSSSIVREMLAISGPSLALGVATAAVMALEQGRLAAAGIYVRAAAVMALATWLAFSNRGEAVALARRAG